MPKYLTQEWLDEFRSLAQDQPTRPGTTVTVQYHTTDGPEGDIAYYWALEDGKIVEAKLGTAPQADFTVTTTYEDAAKIQQGELDMNAAFMQGKMKVRGNVSRMMALLPITASTEWQDLEQKVLAMTDF